MTDYLTPAGCGAGEYEEKRSRFLGRVWPVETEAEAQAHIAAMRKEHYDARHTCFAYIVRAGGITRYGDDGEPQGTAGQPILAVLTGAGAENVCCAVTRYFGGVLLGTGGLVRAYTAAAKAALADAGLAKMGLWSRLALECPYPMFERVKRLLEEHGAVVEGTDFGAQVRFDALVPEPGCADFCAALTELSAGSITPAVTEQCHRAVRI